MILGSPHGELKNSMHWSHPRLMKSEFLGLGPWLEVLSASLGVPGVENTSRGAIPALLELSLKTPGSFHGPSAPALPL